MQDEEVAVLKEVGSRTMRLVRSLLDERVCVLGYSCRYTFTRTVRYSMKSAWEKRERDCPFEDRVRLLWVSRRFSTYHIHTVGRFFRK